MSSGQSISQSVNQSDRQSKDGLALREGILSQRAKVTFTNAAAPALQLRGTALLHMLDIRRTWMSHADTQGRTQPPFPSQTYMYIS